jgi:penicillin-binding protein 1C
MNAPDETFGLGMAIGNVEVTLVELVKAYAGLARSASGVDGGFDPGAAYLVTDMLSGGERASAAMGHVADVVASRFAWKTGTSSAYRDAWTVLWNPEYVVGVWCGHLSGGFGDEALVGAKAAAPKAWKIARSLYPRGDGPWFVEPGCVGRREVCALTGLPAGESCPCRMEGRCLVGRSSPALCTVHVRGFDGRPLERFDAQYAAYAGLLAKAERLSIASPEDGAAFKMVDGMRQQRIVCRPSGAASGERLWWFVDGASVGETEGTAPLALEMSCGRHVLTCTTANGVAAESVFTVER